MCTSLLSLNDGVAGIDGVARLAKEGSKEPGAFATAEPLGIARKLGKIVSVMPV